MTLFDPGPPIENSEPDGPLSADRKRTRRRQALLDQGIHPTTRRPLLTFHRDDTVDGTETCGDCAHHFSHTRNKTYHKCAKTPGGPTRGAASDVRLSWPACAAWEPKTESTET